MFKNIRAHFLIDDIKNYLEDGPISDQLFKRINLVLSDKETSNLEKLKIIRLNIIKEYHKSRELCSILDRINKIC